MKKKKRMLSIPIIQFSYESDETRRIFVTPNPDPSAANGLFYAYLQKKNILITTIAFGNRLAGPLRLFKAIPAFRVWQCVLSSRRLVPGWLLTDRGVAAVPV